MTHITIITRTTGKREPVLETLHDTYGRFTYYIVLSGGKLKRVMADSDTITSTERIPATVAMVAMLDAYTGYVLQADKLKATRQHAWDTVVTQNYYHDGTDHVQYQYTFDVQRDDTRAIMVELRNRYLAVVLAQGRVVAEQLNTIELKESA